MDQSKKRSSYFWKFEIIEKVINFDLFVNEIKLVLMYDNSSKC